jgi:RNA polymerase sigma-70 factor (ECF subfamily)
MLDVDRFTGLYERHYRSIWTYVVRRIPAGTDPGDVVAEVFATTWRRLDGVPTEPDTVLWLYATARRMVANHTRSSRRRLLLWGRLTGLRDNQEAGGVAGADPAGEHAGDRAEVLRALDRLRPAEREAIRLAIWEDLSVADIAQVLGCSPNAVSLRLRRARETLRFELASLLSDPPSFRSPAETGEHGAGLY